MYTLSYQGKSHACFHFALLLSGALSLTGCASTQPATKATASAQVVAPTDPYEGFNRSMYGFNMGLDKYLLKPVSDGYKFITPNVMQTGVSNFFTNLKGINVVLNDMLQGKFEQGASDLGRFTTNSTVGVLGLFDVATDLGLQHNEEDFGQTLAVWGVDQGPYLVLPIMGPTTVRDGAAVVVDKAANPGTYLPGTGVLEGINDRAKADGALNFIDEAALDPYVFTRESFLQYRTNLIKDGKTDADTLDLELEGDVDVGEISEVKPKDAKASEKSKSLGKDGHVKNSVDLGTEKPNATVQAFDSMSKSFDGAEREFEAVSLKMDEYSKKKRRWKRR